MDQSRMVARSLGRACVGAHLFPLVLLLLAAFLAMPSMAAAQNGGVGGEGDFQSTGQSGGAGGVTGVNGGVGGNGGNPNRNCNCTGGGGGGGAADAAGGNGGPGGSLGPTGATGGAVGANGVDGTGSNNSASGGGGGGGGASGASAIGLTNSVTVSGGNGGNGGNGGTGGSGGFSSTLVGGGGGGGAGGTAWTVTGVGVGNTNTGTISGGNGGAGGIGDVGGSGGDGGYGVKVTTSGVIINNQGTISGGAGGAGGAQAFDTYSIFGTPSTGGTTGRAGANGVSAAGIIGAGMTIINTGTIAGGNGPDGQANAISFTGGANTLTSSGTLTGKLGIATGVGASLTLDQTTAAGATGNAVISGITGLDGGSTDVSVTIKGDSGMAVTINGASTYTGGTLVTNGGTLVVGSSTALGTNTLTMGQAFTDHTTLVLNGNGLNIANTIVINSDPAVTVAAGTTNTMSGPISGAGDIVLNGGGTLVLSGANTYTGGTTICGTACGAAGGSSVLQVGVDTVGTVGAITSSAIGTGTLTFDGGTLQAGGNFTIANTAQINSTGGAIDSNGFAFTYSGNISGAGQLTIVDSSFGSGLVTLLGTNNYTGGTFICFCASLALGDATHTASIIGAVTNQGQLAFVNADTSGITTLTNDGGLTAFLNTTSASTMTIINKNVGAVFFQDASSAGSATIKNQGGSVTVFGHNGGTDTATAGNANIDNNGAGTLFFASTNAGTATITNRNGGGTVFSDQSSAAGATITNSTGGITSFGQAFGTDAPTAGNAVITNNKGGETDFNAFSTAGSAIITTNAGGATYFFDNSTGGTAQLITVGTGFVDFSGSLGPNNDGRIPVGSIAGSGFYYIGAGNTLVVGGNNLSTTVSGVIADTNPCGCGAPGPGNLEKVGSGWLTLTGTNTYTGTTVVNGGVLQVDGSIATSNLTTVNSGGALMGIGTVGNTTIASGGIFLAGNGTAGTSMNVAGNLAFQSGALYLVFINSTTSSFASVTGTTQLDGSVGVSVAAGTTLKNKYTILSATGGVSGAFSGVATTGAPANAVASLSYDANNAYLNFTLDYSAGHKLNVNQTNVANALNNFFSANGSIGATYVSLTPGGLTQASGEPATGAQQTTFNAMNLFLGLLTDPFSAGRGGTVGAPGATPYAAESGSLAYAAKTEKNPRDALAAIYAKAPARELDFDQRWNVWAAAYGGSQATDGNAALGSNNTTSSVYGTAVGADYRFSQNTIAGFALAGGGTSFSVNGLGWGRSDLFQAGAYVRHSIGPAYLTAALAYGWQDVTTDRIVTAAGIDHLRARFNANTFAGRFEGGYRYATPWMGITPYAAAQVTTFDLPNYAESVVSGGGTFALTYAAKSVTDTRTELGVRTDKSWAMQNGVLTLRGRVAWAHDFNPDRNVGAVFQALPGAAFVVNGAAQAPNSALTTASAEMKWLNGWSAAATFEGEFSDVTRSYAGKGVLRYSW